MKARVPAALALGVLAIGFAIGFLVGNAGDGTPTAIASPTVSTSTGSVAEASPEETSSPTPEASPSATSVVPDVSNSRFLLIKGNVQLPDGDDGLSLILSGKLDRSGSVPVIVRNNTEEALIRIAVQGTAKSSGKLVGTGADQGLHPNLVMPGEFAFGYVYFESTKFPANTKYAFTVNAESADEASFETILDVVVTRAELVPGNFGDNVVGFVRNPYDTDVGGPIDVSLICMNDSGELTGHEGSFTNKDGAAPGEKLSFRIDVFEDCPNFIVGSSGFSF
jgi:hypothetical protein